MNKKPNEESLDRRRAGLLLHISSLPGNGSTGDLGPAAYQLVGFLERTGFSVWQILPVGPTHGDGSPYQSLSMHAGNPRFVSLDRLVDEGLLPPELSARQQISDREKERLLRAAWRTFVNRRDEGLARDLERFARDEQYWLDEYALFRALREAHDSRSWWEWPGDLRDRKPKAIQEAIVRLAPELDYIRFEQFQFFRQWSALKRHANERGIRLFGDMPIFVSHDSAEVWANREMFTLDAAGQPEVVAGVPPDYFSATGQRWGNPLYRWERMQEDGFSFWVKRMKTQLRLFDLIRIDHFRGFEAYWEIPAEHEHAIHGRWVKTPGNLLFDRLHQAYQRLPLVAEDLGIITPEVDAMRLAHGLPGMKILQFAFSGGPDNPYLPFRHEANSVVYTGTHDNDTTLGWYLSLDDDSRQYVDEYLGRSREAMPWPLIRMALASRSKLAVIPMQDILGLDGSHRMNLPGSTEGNWSWRFDWSQVDEELPHRLRRRVEMYGRLG
ncbi:MAG: 4-alpha-glucanotransferase [Gammaproteobacteria bacterium]|nr:4-alpha-glucanotransferase [Gammaproteobacteria bacterium]